MHRHQMQHPGYGLRLACERGRRRAQDGVARVDDFGLDKEFAEGRMRRVSRGRRQHHFGVARDINATAGTRP